MTFSSLEQRLAQGFLDMLPSFVPDKNAPVSVPQQEDFYALIRGLYQLAFDEPLLFVGALHEDDAYPTRFKKGYGKPGLILDMKKFTKPVYALLQAMFLLGQGEQVALNKRQRAILARLGVDDTASPGEAWRWMATRDGAHVVRFSHCLFDDDYPYSSEVYARLLGASAFRRLEGWMLAQGYERFDAYHIIASDCDLTLTIANPRWSAEPPRGGFEYKIRHTGISAQYDGFVRTPAVLGLCIPNGLKAYLEAFDRMSGTLQAFVVQRTKKCDNCRYCVQTDKTGMRPLACIPVAFEGTAYHLCPYFPGYSYSCNSMDDALVDRLIEMLAFMDGFAPQIAECPARSVG